MDQLSSRKVNEWQHCGYQGDRCSKRSYGDPSKPLIFNTHKHFRRYGRSAAGHPTRKSCWYIPKLRLRTDRVWRIALENTAMAVLHDKSLTMTCAVHDTCTRQRKTFNEQHQIPQMTRATSCGKKSRRQVCSRSRRITITYF
ncbi:uncharacterized protein LOC132950744 [Metopolophium dirhodum]|uniref:uncharacterized protein LOC132950744 n=1 Tax=Metopolophium dirhodum TaxID=44670 RepID=UPI0029905257|nr:uncharacterized protein LOC132950744 [Metopolophium dirhodum]